MYKSPSSISELIRRYDIGYSPTWMIRKIAIVQGVLFQQCQEAGLLMIDGADELEYVIQFLSTLKSGDALSINIAKMKSVIDEEDPYGNPFYHLFYSIWLSTEAAGGMYTVTATQTTNRIVDACGRLMQCANFLMNPRGYYADPEGGAVVYNLLEDAFSGKLVR